MSNATTPYSAQFHNVAADIFPEYDDQGCILNQYKRKKKQMIQQYIDQNKERIYPGDILFVGSTSDIGRQYENGFVMVGKNYQMVEGQIDGGAYLPISHYQELPPSVSYRELLQKMILVSTRGDEGEQYVAALFWNVEPGFEDEMNERCISLYQEIEIY